MQIADILVPERVCVGADASSKKRVLEITSRLLLEGTSYTVSHHVVFDRLNGRERLGSTGLGFGVALPHGRLGEVEVAVGAFVHTSPGVDFDAPDREPVVRQREASSLPSNNDFRLAPSPSRFLG